MLAPVSLFVLLTLAAPPAKGPAAAPPAPGLAEVLVKEAGGPVLLVAAPDGLVAQTPEGRVVRRLTTGAVDGAALDAARDLVWLTGDGKLGVVDLRAPEPALVPIATGLPPDVPFRVRREKLRKAPAYAVGSAQGREDDWVELVWGARPAVRMETLGIWEDEGPKPALQLVGAAWLKEQRERPARPARGDAPAPASFDETARVAPPATLASCEEPTLCGRSAPFGARGWRLVLTSHECGDFCYIGCLLWDPAAKRWAVPDERLDWVEGPANTGSCGPYLFDPAATRWAIGEALCAATGDCRPLGGRAVGWLPPGPRAGE